MAKISTDPELIEKFLTRGVETIYPCKDDLRQKLMSGERITAYQGFDPTGPYLHMGHAMGIRALRILQKLGHEVVFLVGDYTSKVGDPDKKREIMSDEEIKKNMRGWKEQAEQLIDFEGDNPVLFKHNYEWLSKLTLHDLIHLMSNATVQQIAERDMFQKRLKENDPIRLQEFIYPLMQGYDSVAMNVDLELGGTDQTFNMLMGRELVKKYNKKEKFVRVHEIMEAPDGLIMSKTKGNGVNLGDSSEDIYGKAMSYPDELILKALRLLTDISLTEIWEMQKSMESGENPMNIKKTLAYELVKTLRGKDEANKAEQHFKKVIQNKETDSESVSTTKVSGVLSLLEFLKQALEYKDSASQIKRVIEQGGVEIDGKKIVESFLEIDFKPGMVVKYGKRRFIKVEA